MMQQVLGFNFAPPPSGYVQHGDYVVGNMQELINRLFQQHEAYVSSALLTFSHTPAASKKYVDGLPRRNVGPEEIGMGGND